MHAAVKFIRIGRIPVRVCFLPVGKRKIPQKPLPKTQKCGIILLYIHWENRKRLGDGKSSACSGARLRRRSGNQLIARRVREHNVYCEVKLYKTSIEEIKALNPIGIIFTGGPNSVYEEKSPKCDPALFELGVPVLGICYGCQLMAHTLGGEVTAAQEDTAREYGKTETFYNTDCKLFKGLPEQGISWMSHGDYMAKVPEGFELVAHTDMCPTAAIADEKRGFYGVQYHPEVNHTENGSLMLKNFLYEVCHAKGDWTMGDYKNSSIKAIREKVGDGKVLLALSGGVDLGCSCSAG